MNTLNTINAIFSTLVVSSSFEHKEYNKEENICYVFNRKTKKRTQVTQMPEAQAVEAEAQAVEAESQAIEIASVKAVIHSKASTQKHLKKLDALEAERVKQAQAQQQ